MSKKSLATHRFVHRDKDQWFKCKICDRKFAHKLSLIRHILIHEGVKPFKCSECGKTFRHKPNLKYHMLVHNNDPQYQCEKCDKKFNTPYHLMKHSVSIHGSKSTNIPIVETQRFQCNTCGKKFLQKGNLVEHIPIHNPDMQYRCEHCEKRFAHSANLKRHIMSMHITERPFKCEKCNKGFIEKRRWDMHLKSKEHKMEKNEMNDHEVTSEAYKPFLDVKNKCKCGKCGKVFQCEAKLILHIDGHLGIKRYKCDLCNKRFR